MSVGGCLDFKRADQVYNLHLGYLFGAAIKAASGMMQAIIWCVTVWGGQHMVYTF